MSEYICDVCNGKGKVYRYPSDEGQRCLKCNGSGKLNWIENVFGKQQKVIFINTKEELIKHVLSMEKIGIIK